MTRTDLRALLDEVRDGALTPEAAQQRLLQFLRQAPFEDLGFARVDHHRSVRQGFPEVVFGQGKTPGQIAAIAARIAGKFGRADVEGVHIKEADEITIEGDASELILDGESFTAETGRPIRLRAAQPLSFVKLAA